jgi:hypothetical protein
LARAVVEEVAVTPKRPGPGARWRCAQCGNLTRFDVERTARIREFVHAAMSGEQTVDATEVVEETIESVTCRWCGSERIEEVPRPRADDGDE